jgi:hypothetical protein
MRERRFQTLFSVLVLCAALIAVPAQSGEVAKANLDILGLGLEVLRDPITTPAGVPATVQTRFGGEINERAPAAPGMSALAELTGPGIVTPITLAATPGHKFTLPPLHEKGEYALQNIRLAGASGEFLQQSIPSFATITVTDVLKTEVRVRQLTPEELRERGITVDLRNYDVYEYTVIFGVEDEFVEIPYPVIVDKRTHEVQKLDRENKYRLPTLEQKKPPRFTPPVVEEFEFSPGGGGPPESEPDPPGAAGPRIPAAIILPNGFGVLHQFFAVIVQVSNTSPDDKIRLDNIAATISMPPAMRTSKVVPATSLGQPVAIYDEKTNTTFLVAGARGSAEWTLEALKAGTHSIDITVEADYQQEGQPQFRMRGRASTAIVVNDPRFQITFSHPDNVRTDEPYTAYAFITNLSAQRQHIRLEQDSSIPLCDTGGKVNNICRTEGPDVVELDLDPGEMKTVDYKLTSRITGHVFAGAGAANDEALSVAVKLHMGVSQSGIPLSPATLVMPYYARFLPGDFIAANMQLLGLGYSVATAPLTKHTARFPRVIKSDVFQRAQEIARAGQRVFATRAHRETDNPEENRDAYFHLALDLLGNVERVDQATVSPDLQEWDELRRKEISGRRAANAMGAQLVKHGLHDNRTHQQFVTDFAEAGAHRNPYFFAYVHGADVAGETRPYPLELTGIDTQVELDVPSDATTGHVRLMPYAELMSFNAAGEKGELAIVGRWSESIRVRVIPRASSFTLHLIYPDTASGAHLRSDIAITNATPGLEVKIDVVRGSRTLIVSGGTATPMVNPVQQPALRVLGAAQDLHLNEHGRLVSVLFNRPLKVADALKLRDQFALTINVPKANYTITRRNSTDTTKPIQIPAAALQADARLINVTFDKPLSTNANYVLAVEKMRDLVVPAAPLLTASNVIPRIDNNAPGGILTGRVLNGDNTAVQGAEVILTARGPQQIEVAEDDGRYMFEFVARDIANGIDGTYKMEARANGRQTKVEGAVRLVGEVHNVNLVFLGRGRANGHVKYSDGEVLKDTTVTIGSTLFGHFRSGRTNDDGFYEIGDLPAGPLTFSVVDPDGRPTFAANAIRFAGEVITQDLVLEKTQFPGTGTVRVTVRRADTNEVVEGARVGVYTQGYGLTDGASDPNGFIEFRKVPAGLISIIAAHFGISRETPGIELEMKADQIVERTIYIGVPPPGNSGYASMEGVVFRDDPAAPGDRSKDVPVPGAIITIGNLPPVTAGANGAYTYPDLPVGLSGKQDAMLVFDPATGRKAWFGMPSLFGGQSARFSPVLSSSSPEGEATIRVRLTSATGDPVTDYRVIEPGFPPDVYAHIGGGVYERTGIRVPMKVAVVAVPKNPNGPYGDQMAGGKGRVDFAGQVGIINIRLPGQGTIISKLELRQQQDACPTTEPCYTTAFGKVAINYSVWDEIEQMTKLKTVIKEADPVTQLNTFTKVPARQETGVYTDRHPAGFDSEVVGLAYEGDTRTVLLRMETLGDVSGRVFSYDRQTPIGGAVVRLENGRVIYGTQLTKPDGSFRFAGIQADLSFRVVAEYTRDGIFRTGYADGKTSLSGGGVGNLIVVMREQSNIEGQVVDSAGNPIPLARYAVTELAWPNTKFGTDQEPLQADINGKFYLTNVFTGPFRITARDPVVQEQRGHYQGELRFEGDTSQLTIRVVTGSNGLGSIIARIVDSTTGNAPVQNAEVRLFRNGESFDLGSTDEHGIARFEKLPAGSNYSISAYSKSAGRAGSSSSFALAKDGTVNIEVVLSFLGKVAGYVTDPESDPKNQPSRGDPVQVDSPGVSQRTSTDSEGRFEVKGVPEGPFKLFVYDLESGRMAFGPPNLFISKTVQEHTNLHLELEKTATLTVNAYLPADNGQQGELAPLVDVLVEATDYYRESQGQSLKFERMITRYGYKITAKELGGEHRKVIATGGWPAGVFEKTHNVTFPSTGSAIVNVRDNLGNPVADAKVSINGSTMYTPTSGSVELKNIPFGWVTVYASKNALGASDGKDLRSRSIPLVFDLNLGQTVDVAGTVLAEEGVNLPSPSTRVVMTIHSRLVSNGSRRLETFTGADGRFRFTGVPVGDTKLHLIYYGPDDTTIGWESIPHVVIPNTQTTEFVIAPKRLDATPPRVLKILPAANENNVSPTANVIITFSEQVAAQYLTSQYLQLRANDSAGTVPVEIIPSVRPDDTFEVTLKPIHPAGQKYPLKSNMLYRLSVVQGIQDTTGNGMLQTVGAAFTTVDYSEPAVVRVSPDSEDALASATFFVKFNKQVDINSFKPEYGAVLKLEKIDKPNGAVVQTMPLVEPYLDPADPTTVVVAISGAAIEESSFYRLTVDKVRDLQVPPNIQKDIKIVEWFSFDETAPVARIISPVAEGEKLVSGVLYRATVEVTDEGTTTEADDVDVVHWLDADGKYLTQRKEKPWAYEFEAPPTDVERTFTLQVSARDLSGNPSPAPAPLTWTVIPNAPPKDVKITLTAGSAYPTQTVGSSVTFSDEGVKVTVSIRLVGQKTNGDPLTIELDSKQITRAKATDPWPAVTFSTKLPLDLKPGTAQIIARVAELKATEVATDLEVLDDQAKPEVVSTLPKAETRYKHKDPYTIELKVRDAQTGINANSVTFSIAGTAVPVADITKTVDTATGIHTFRYSTTAGARNADTRVPIVSTIADGKGNVTTNTTEVIFERVDDAGIPVAAWITPLDGAPMPFGTLMDGWEATLRIQATDDQAVTKVRFESDRFVTPVTPLTLANAGAGHYQAKVKFKPWTAEDPMRPFVVTAFVEDVEPAHTVELPITIEPVVVDKLVQSVNAISSVTVGEYTDKNVVVRGTGFEFPINVPVRMKNFLILDGAKVSAFEETKLDLTVTERLFIDADSRIDVTDRGYLGGNRTGQPSTNKNASDTGRTLGGTTTGGATSSGTAGDASHAGIGGENPDNSTNATYGSITNPLDFGAGGSSVSTSSVGGNGGGVLHIRGAAAATAKLIIAGGLRADGGTGANRSGAGAGGSINLEAHSLVTGPKTRITVNGGDDDSDPSAPTGGGAGRMAIRVAQRFDVADRNVVLQARGGRNGTTDSDRHVDGGAGTIFVQSLGATKGELIVSAFDADYPTSTGKVRGTPLAGTLDFDTITIGPRTLARFDDAYTATAFNADPTALVLTPEDVPTITINSTTPASGSQVTQGTNVAVNFIASSDSGITRARTTLAVQPTSTFSSFDTTPVTTPVTNATVKAPETAPEGATTLKVLVTDRAGRTAESAPIPFTIVTNAAPNITVFNVTPPDQVYAGGRIDVSITATDDVAVNNITLTSSHGTPLSGTWGGSAVTPRTRTYNWNIAQTLASGTKITLTATATDQYPVSTTKTHELLVRKDEGLPIATVVKPQPNQVIQEVANGTIDFEITATDAEVGVKSVTATFEGQPHTLTFVSGTTWRKTGVPLPDVEGSTNVEKTVTFNVADFEGNIKTESVTFYIKPLNDPSAPELSWLCTSPNAMYPAGTTVPLRVTAMPRMDPETGITNGTSKVELSIDGGANVLATRMTGTENWTYDFAIPADAAVGKVYTLRAVATSTSNKTSTITGSFTVVNGVVISTKSFINADDTAYTANTSIIIASGGEVIVTGPRALKNVVVLSGGKLVQQHLDIGKADLMTVERLFVACGGEINVTGLGYAKNTTYPGAGLTDDGSGGSHIGRGGLWSRKRGGVFGSVYRPMEAGGGGVLVNSSSTANGGGSVRISATASATVDGAIKARGANGANTYGTSAGGSIWITTPTLSGGGSADASGGDFTAGSGATGGGGAIAFEYGTASGKLLSNLVAKAGGVGRPGGAGSIYLKSADATYGTLRIDNSGLATTYAATELPAFGRTRAASVTGDSITLDGKRWLSPALAGHWVRVFAADGTARGTWRIESVTNPATSTPVNGFFEVLTQDAFVYDGYVVYSPAGIGGKKAVAARYASGRWEYDSDSTFTPFNPQTGDAIIAAFKKDATGITDVTTFDCSSPCAPVQGLPVRELAQGEILPNSVGGIDGSNQWFSGRRDVHELFLRSDFLYRGIVLSDGTNASVKLTGATGVQQGDVLRGIYRFDAMDVKNARVITEDLLEVTATPVVDVASTITKGNDALPVVTPSAVTIGSGLTAPVLIGSANAVADAETPVVAIAQNNNTLKSTRPIVWDAPTVLLGNRGGASIVRPPNGHAGAYGIASLHAITTSGFVRFMAAQTNKVVMAGLAPDNTTVNYSEPGMNGFKLLATGAYEVWSNGANANKNGTYNTSTLFRVERTPSAIRWFVNNTQVHERTGTLPARLLFDVSFENVDTAELHSIVYDPSNADNGTYAATATASGTFSMPVFGNAGDPIALSAQDGHTFTYRSAPVVVATLPSTLGVQSVTFAESEVTGGRPTTGTVTLVSPAGAEGSLVTLASSSAAAVVPATVTVAAGATNANFNITTTAVQTAVSAVITASWGGMSASGTLQVTRDAMASEITVTSPAANAQYTEGSGKIPIQATVVDPDSGVKRVYATLAGQIHEMPKDATKGANVYYALVNAPFVDGDSPVTLDVVVNALDNLDNLATAPARPVVINPVVDSGLPTLTWVCSSDQVFIGGTTATLRVTATPPKADNAVQRVEFQIAGQTTLVATLTSTANVYEAQWLVPNTDATYNVTAAAFVAGGGTASVPGTITGFVPEHTFSANATVSATDTQYDNKSIAVTGGTLTISGAHSFKNFIVIGGTVTHASLTPLTINATGRVYVGCGASIDASGDGYGPNTTYPGERASAFETGGSHIGRGGSRGAHLSGNTYGSIYRPREMGGGGNDWPNPGGGAIRISAPTVGVAGTINVTGVRHYRGGAGGSVWITATRVTGGGTIDASGASSDQYGAGGGGAIAIEYTDATSVMPILRSAGGRDDCSSCTVRHGGAGTVYLRGPSSRYGTVVVDTPNEHSYFTELPSLGKGAAQAASTGATVATDKTTAIPVYFEGHWVEIRDAAGVVKGTWRIAGVSGTTFTLQPAAGETIAIVPGDQWQGVYLFDQFEMKNWARVNSVDPIYVDGDLLVTGPSTSWQSVPPITAKNVTISGSANVTSIKAENMTITSTGAVSQFPIETGHANGRLVSLDVANTLVIDGRIDVTGDGYRANDTYPGERASAFETGGSHMGRGGSRGGHASGSTFGSVYRPQEAGGGGNDWPNPGGGIVRIKAHTVRLDGQILALGVRHYRGGAGGSVWISSTKITGAGSIDASGATSNDYGAGGGGAVAIEYSDATSFVPSVRNSGGRDDCGSCTARHGGAGSTYIRGAGQTYGTLVVDNELETSAQTELPSLGNGAAQAGSTGATIVTNKSANIQPYFEGHWVEVRNAAGVLKGTWRIRSISGKSFTLEPAASETISIIEGDQWRGVYLFDKVELKRWARLSSADPILSQDELVFSGPATNWMYAPPLVAKRVTISGSVYATSIKAEDLTITSTGTLSHLQIATGLPGNRGLSLDIADTLAIDGKIDVSGQGYRENDSYPGETTAPFETGGSHMGRGGSRNDGAATASTFGSLYQPREPGGGGNDWPNPGGGVVRIKAGTVRLDGQIRALGARHYRGGAGGSVWITTTKIFGTGSIDASGATSNDYGAGGGGAIALEYTDPTSTRPTIRNSGGRDDCSSCQYRHGGAGTTFVRAAGQTYGTLIVANDEVTPKLTELPSLGNGAAQDGTGGATVVTNRARDIPVYFEGHWVEIRNAAGIVKGMWRIGSINAKSFTLAAAQGETISVVPGDLWQGVYRFDNVELNKYARVTSTDPVIAENDYSFNGTPGSDMQMKLALVAKNNVNVNTGSISLNSIKAKNVTVASGAVITHPTITVNAPGLTIDVTDTITVDGKIDVSGRGYPENTTYPGERSSAFETGGSHMGRGGARSSNASGSTFGSIYRPLEAGGGGNDWPNPGGGALHMKAASVAVNGSILANGVRHYRGGAGGSIWIQTARISGTGLIEASGATSNDYGAGGGGAIALEYTEPTSVRPTLRASGGLDDCASCTNRHGGAGTIFVRQPTSVFGELTISNNVNATFAATELPSLGSGIAQPGSTGATLVTERASFQPYFAGHYVEILRGGSLVQTVRIASITGSTLTLEAISGGTAPNVLPGDEWQGVYKFDTATFRTQKISSGDPLRGTRDDGTTVVDVNDGPPVFPAGKRSTIKVDSTATADAVIGDVGAVADVNVPIKLVVTNVRTGVKSAETAAAADGSFRIPVSGIPGDTFTLVATDSHAIPRTSPSITVNGTITAQAHSSIEISPETIVAGSTATAVVRVSPVPQKSIQVALQRSNTSITIPASLTFAAGESAKQFPIATPANASGAVTITATHGTSASATLTILQSVSSTIHSIVLSGTTVEGGTTVNGTVYLGAPAPAGGAEVMLASSSDRAILPSSVVVPAGAAEVSFSVVTLKVGAATQVLISGTYGETKAAPPLTLNPCASMSNVAPPANTTIGTVWVEDAAPAGATVTGTGATWDSTQVATGSTSLHFADAVAPAPPQRAYAFGQAAPLAVAATDSLVFYMLANPCNPPKQVVVTFAGDYSFTATWGESRIDAGSSVVNRGTVPADGAWVRMEIPIKAFPANVTTTTVTSLSVSVYGGEAWFDRFGATACSTPTAPAPSFDDNELVWFDDALPAGATVDAPTATRNNWNWSNAQVASGSVSHVEGPQAGLHEHAFYNATQGMLLRRGDVLFTYVYLDPCNPPKSVMLSFYDGQWRRAYWGENLFPSDWGSDGATTRMRMGPLPELGKWVRLEVPVSIQGLEDRTITGGAYVLVDGRAWFDRAGKYSRVNLALNKQIAHSGTDHGAQYVATMANDGRLDTFSHNNGGAQGWIQLDLGAVQPIEQIQIWNRSDCCTDRLGNHFVMVSDKPFSTTSPDISLADGASKYHWVGSTANVHSYAVAVNRTGRYVRVQMAGSNYMHLREIDVYAPAASKRVNVAGGAATSSSAPIDAGTSHDAGIDGHWNNAAGSGPSVFRSTSTSEAWWQVDLGKVTSISTIDLFSRIGGLPADFTDFYVFVSDVPFTGTTTTQLLAEPNVHAQYYGIPAFTMHSLYVNRTGRYVRLQKRAAGELSFAEVQVWSQLRALGALARPADTQ